MVREREDGIYAPFTGLGYLLSTEPDVIQVE
jgi:hypothetical protein